MNESIINGQLVLMKHQENQSTIQLLGWPAEYGITCEHNQGCRHTSRIKNHTSFAHMATIAILYHHQYILDRCLVCSLINIENRLYVARTSCNTNKCGPRKQ